jgi:AraC-like DNA-binding protein
MFGMWGATDGLISVFILSEKFGSRLYYSVFFLYLISMKPDSFRQDFFSRLDGINPLKELLDQLPDVAFFIKDRRGRFVLNNRRGFECCRANSEMETIGKTDFDFFPRNLAQHYRDGDQAVMETGLPILNAIEPAPEESLGEKLIVSTKIPLRDRRKRIIGVAGMHREFETGPATHQRYGTMARAIQHINAHYAENIEMQQLASMLGISDSQFARRFRKLLGVSPKHYLLRVRINNACTLLAQTAKPITEIAMEVGFYDNPHFTRTFSKLMGSTPLAYRKTRQRW